MGTPRGVPQPANSVPVAGMVTNTGAVIPNRLYCRAPGLTRAQTRAMALHASEVARTMSPRLSGTAANGIQPYWGEGYFGVKWSRSYLWHQEAGTKPFTMRSLAGKAQPLDELVLTPTGWSKMGDIHAGDLVSGGDGKPTRVVAVYPQGEVESWRVTFSDGESVRCNPDHLWSVRYTGGGAGDYRNRYQVRSTTYLAERPHGHWHVPLVSSPVEYADADPISIDPYLVGVMLSEGCRGSSPTFAQKQEPLVDEVRKVLPPGVALTPHGNQWIITAGPRGTTLNPVARTLRDLGLMPSQDNSTSLRVCPECGSTEGKRGPYISSRSVMIHRAKAHGVFASPRTNRTYGLYSYQKFIPESIMVASAEDRLSLLQGLMDGDGSCPTQGAVRYHTSSPRLAQDVAELARSLGCEAEARADKEVRAKANHLMFTVRINCPEGLVPFRALLPKRLIRFLSNQTRLSARSKRIVSIEPDGVAEMQCLSVEADDGLYLTSGFTVTHNTIPMWVDDWTGEMHRADPKAKTRITANGRRQILIFRKVGKIGARKRVAVRDGQGRLQRWRSVPQSYPGAPGRIVQRQWGPVGSTGRIALLLSMPHVGVRWRHPGLMPREFMQHAIQQVAMANGIEDTRIYATYKRA